MAAAALRARGPGRGAVNAVRLVKQFISEDDDGRLQPFEGVVVAYDARHRLYKVLYSDGDGEEMSWAELKHFVTELPTPSPAAGRKRRTRSDAHAGQLPQQSRSASTTPQPDSQDDAGDQQPGPSAAAQARRRAVRKAASQASLATSPAAARHASVSPTSPAGSAGPAGAAAAPGAAAAAAAAGGAAAAAGGAAAAAGGAAAAAAAAAAAGAPAPAAAAAVLPKKFTAKKSCHGHGPLCMARHVPTPQGTLHAAAGPGLAGGTHGTPVASPLSTLGAAHAASPSPAAAAPAAARTPCDAALADGAAAGAAAGESSGGQARKRRASLAASVAIAKQAAGQPIIHPAPAASSRAAKAPRTAEQQQPGSAPAAAAAATAPGGGGKRGRVKMVGRKHVSGSAEARGPGKPKAGLKKAAGGAAAGGGTAQPKQRKGGRKTAPPPLPSQPGGLAPRPTPVPQLAAIKRRIALALEASAPAQACERAWRSAEAAALTDAGAVAAAAAGAGEVVLTPDGERPLFELDESDVPLVRDNQQAEAHLAATATKFAPGREPFRRFVLPADVMDQCAAAASAAGLLPASPRRRSHRSSSGGSSSGGGGSGGGDSGAGNEAAGALRDAVAAAAAALDEGRGLYLAAQQFDDPDSALASAVSSAKDKFWSTYRLACVSETLRCQRILAEIAAAKAVTEGGGDAAGPSSSQGGAGADADAADEEGEEQEADADGEDGSSSGSGAKGRQARGAGAARLPKRPCCRPDRVAESKCLEEGHGVNDRSAWGHVPGIRINHKFMLRSEASVLGLHKMPLHGIVTGVLPVPIVVNGTEYRNVRAATSISMSGLYEDDRDGDGAHGGGSNGGGGGEPATVVIAYTGQGGNDLLGSKKQIAAQQLKGGNKALLANIALGLPVRVLRRNDDACGAMKTAIYYDGLYDVVSYVKTLGKQGHPVYKFGIRRREGQEASHSKPIRHFKGVGTAKRGVDILTREHVVCRDLSKGAEALPLVVVNEVDRELPPGLSLPEDKALLVDDEEDRPLQASRERLTYLTHNVYDEGIAPPAPPRVLDEGSPEAEALAAGAPRGTRLLWNGESVVRKAGEAPHELLARINGGALPYIVPLDAADEEDGGGGGDDGGGGGGKRKKKAGRRGEAIPMARFSRVLVECGDWTGCTDANCPQRQAHRGLRYRLEVFKTPDRGWGVRSWDPIKAGSLVCIMWGKVHRDEDVGEGRRYDDSPYFFGMTPRSDFGLDGRKLADGERKDVAPRYTLCARDQGGVARFINHSCEPALYVQPLCIGHTDTDMVAIGLFAASTIPPFTELSYDYGDEYILTNLDGVCLCGADSCKHKPGRQALVSEQEEEEAGGEQGGEAAADEDEEGDEGSGQEEEEGSGHEGGGSEAAAEAGSEEEAEPGSEEEEEGEREA